MSTLRKKCEMDLLKIREMGEIAKFRQLCLFFCVYLVQIIQVYKIDNCG